MLRLACAVWSETLLALIFYECLSYWPNIIWSCKLKRWLHRLVAFTPHWWRQSYDTATARGRVNISCCKKENEKKNAANEITRDPVWHNWGNKTALHFLQTAKGTQWLGCRVLDLRPRRCGSKLALCPRSLLSTWSTWVGPSRHSLIFDWDVTHTHTKIKQYKNNYD